MAPVPGASSVIDATGGHETLQPPAMPLADPLALRKSSRPQGLSAGDGDSKMPAGHGRRHDRPPEHAPERLRSNSPTRSVEQKFLPLGADSPSLSDSDDSSAQGTGHEGRQFSRAARRGGGDRRSQPIKRSISAARSGPSRRRSSSESAPMDQPHSAPMPEKSQSQKSRHRSAHGGANAHTTTARPPLPASAVQRIDMLLKDRPPSRHDA